MNKKLFILLKENEIPLFENENNNNNKNNDDKNIENILKRIEYNIENQYDIIYQQWLNYDSI